MYNFQPGTCLKQIILGLLSKIETHTWKRRRVNTADRGNSVGPHRLAIQPAQIAGPGFSFP